MSALSVVLSIHIGRRRKLGEVSCTEGTGHGNDFELIPTVEMETRNPEEGYFGGTVIFSKFCSESFHCDTDRRVVFKFSENWLTENW